VPNSSSASLRNALEGSTENDQRQRAATPSFIPPRAARQGHEGLRSGPEPAARRRRSINLSNQKALAALSNGFAYDSLAIRRNRVDLFAVSTNLSFPATPVASRPRMIPKSGNRFSEKMMRKETK